MEKPEMVASGERKRELSEDDIVDDSEESDYSIGYDSDDPSFEILEGKADRKIWNQYFKEWDESEDKMYAFEEIVNVNASFAAGTWYYFTFKARDATVDDDAIKTFQAKVWHGINGIRDVSLCRLKKFLTDEDKKKKKKKKKSQQDGKAAVEQDKLSLVMESFIPGLVIEELSKGKPGGRKAYPGFKVGIRYTGKLKENDEIFNTNIGEGDPLEFRIASGQLIKGWEIGVDGMRVGDKRRITIPPFFGYGAAGCPGIPPDSWLVIEVELMYVRNNSAES